MDKKIENSSENNDKNNIIEKNDIDIIENNEDEK